MKILMRSDRAKKWQLVQSAAFSAETELQELLAGTPSLITLNEVQDGAGALVAAVREFPLDVGYIDLLGFTTRGDIAVIECKLAQNDEVKRKVIGQVLAYGASLWEMDYETLDEKIMLRCGKNLADLVREGVDDPEWDEEAFRANIKAALETGNFILMIVVDEIREELERIVRFINDAGKPAFSFAALEMRRFHHDRVEMLVPHVFCASRKPAVTAANGKKQWDEPSFLSKMAEQKPDCLEPTKKILAWVYGCNEPVHISWGKGTVTAAFVPVLTHAGRNHPLFAVYTYGTIEIYFYWYKYHAPFDSEEKRIELLKKLNQIKGVDISQEGIHRRPNIPLAVFNDPQALHDLLQAFEWLIREIKEANPE